MLKTIRIKHCDYAPYIFAQHRRDEITVKPHKTHQIPKLECFSSWLVIAVAQSTEAGC